MLTIRTAAGSRSRVAFSTAMPGDPLKTKPNTSCWRSRIQDIPDHIQVHSCASIQLHCSVGGVDCMSVLPPECAEEQVTTLGCDGSTGESQATCPPGHRLPEARLPHVGSRVG